MKSIDLTPGDVYGRLTVVRLVEGKRRLWLCRCSCGGAVRTSSWNIRSGFVVSCGCRKKEHLVSMSSTHGDSKSAEYKAWENMISRCECTKAPYYKDYGGRGIEVCKRWRESYGAFLEDMGRKPSPKHELDRFPDNDGDYEPGNCRWATRSQQLNNLRCTLRLTIDGETRSVTEWARISGIHPATIKARIKADHDPKDAVFREVRRRNPSRPKG